MFCSPVFWLFPHLVVVVFCFSSLCLHSIYDPAGSVVVVRFIPRQQPISSATTTNLKYYLFECRTHTICCCIHTTRQPISIYKKNESEFSTIKKTKKKQRKEIFFFPFFILFDVLDHMKEEEEKKWKISGEMEREVGCNGYAPVWRHQHTNTGRRFIVAGLAAATFSFHSLILRFFFYISFFCWISSHSHFYMYMYLHTTRVVVVVAPAFNVIECCCCTTTTITTTTYSGWNSGIFLFASARFSYITTSASIGTSYVYAKHKDEILERYYTIAISLPRGTSMGQLLGQNYKLYLLQFDYI